MARTTSRCIGLCFLLAACLHCPILVPQVQAEDNAYLKHYLLTDPDYGDLNHYIVREIGDSVDTNLLAIKIGTLNKLAGEAGFDQHKVLNLFKKAVIEAKRNGLEAESALDAVSGSISFRLALDSVSGKDRDVKPAASLGSSDQLIDVRAVEQSRRIAETQQAQEAREREEQAQREREEEKQRQEDARGLALARSQLRHTFTDASGDFTVDATVVKVEGGKKVDIVRMSDKKLITVDFNRLSASDRHWIVGNVPAIRKYGATIAEEFQGPALK